MRSSVLGRWAMAVSVVMLLITNGVRAQTPSPDDTLRAFRVVEKHIRGWELPAESATKETENTAASRAVGACVTLKLRGEVVGRGAAWSDAIAGPEAFSSDVLRRAILAAMRQAEPKLGVPNDAMREAAIKLVAPDVLISVELAGPLSVVEFNSWEDAEVTLRPGLDGVAARIGGVAGGNAASAAGTLHAIFPSQMMLGNMLPHRAMGAVAARAMGEGGAASALDEPKKLREVSGVRMYRFRVGQVVQSVGTAPSVQYRGARMIGANEMASVGDLRMFAARLASHLNRWIDANALVTGVTNPERLRNTTIAAASVWECAELLGDQRIVKSAKRVVGGGPPPTPHTDDEAALAEWRMQVTFLLGVADSGEPCGTPFLDGINQVWKGAKTKFAYTDPTFLDGCPASTRSYCQSLFVKCPGIEGRSSSNAAVSTLDKSVRAMWKEMAGRSVVSELPWIGWTEIAIADAKSKSVTQPKSDITSALALRQVRNDCWKHQLSITDATEDTLDMTGGIIFTAGDGKGGGNPYPTWQCVRPLAFIATMLRDPRLTEPQERAEQIVRLMQAARFLRQLQVDEASAWMYPDPAEAMGGIRASTWDNSLPVDATSMTLLFVVELIKSLDALSAEKAVVPANAPASVPAGK